jgi:hypothetical protein
MTRGTANFFEMPILSSDDSTNLEIHIRHRNYMNTHALG